jgi:hypothetical protein
MNLRRYKKINNKKVLVKVYERKLSDDEIWVVLADTIEILNEQLKINPNQAVIQVMIENAMLNPKFRQIQDHQRISYILRHAIKKETGSILNLMNKLEEILFFETL